MSHTIEQVMLNLACQGAFPQACILDHGGSCEIRTFLQALFSALYCEVRTACGQCHSCLLALNGQLEDALWVDESDGYKVKDIDRILEHLRDSGLVGQPRVVILLAAEGLNIQAENRLLKILEEPPAGSYVILATSRYGALLPTIRSRLLRWRLGRNVETTPHPASSLDHLELQWNDEYRQGAGCGVLSDEAQVRILVRRRRVVRARALIRARTPVQLPLLEEVLRL